MMSGKILWIAFIVTIQISSSLCRTTGKPYDEAKEVMSIDESSVQVLNQTTGKNTSESGLNVAIANGKMKYDVYVDVDNNTRNTLAPVYIAIIIIVCLFSLAFLIIGVITICCCKKGPRQGYIVNRNTEQQTNVVQDPRASEFVNPMQQYPPPYGQN